VAAAGGPLIRRAAVFELSHEIGKLGECLLGLRGYLLRRERGSVITSEEDDAAGSISVSLAHGRSATPSEKRSGSVPYRLYAES